MSRENAPRVRHLTPDQSPRAKDNQSPGAKAVPEVLWIMTLIAIVLAMALAASSGQACASEAPGRMGVYVTFRSLMGQPDAMRAEMKAMREAGVEFILPLAKSTAGEVYWDSSIAPEELVKDPKHLSRLTEIAHQEGLKVYPWVCVCTEGKEDSLNAVLRAHPDWATVTADGPIGVIDPGNPEARAYEVSLIREMLRDSKADGVSLDYLRASNRFAYTPSLRREFIRRYKTDPAEIIGAGKDSVATEGGKTSGAKAAVSPRKHPLWPRWRELYRDAINTLAGEIAAGVREARPDASISSYVWGAHTYGPTSEAYQDYKTWVRKGWLDWINPTGYRYTDESFIAAARANRATIPQSFPMLITIGVRTSHGSLATAAEVKHHMELARQEGAQGLVFFTWEALKPFAEDLEQDIKGWRPKGEADAAR